MDFLDKRLLNEMKCGMFNNISYFKKSSKVLKSGVCKYMRREKYDKLEWCIIEMMIFGLKKEGLMTNIINRLKILIMEEIVCSDAGLIVELINNIDEINKNKNWNRKIEFIIRFCDILPFCRKGRICSYLNCWYRYNPVKYNLDSVILNKVLKYKKVSDSEELLKYGELLINFIENRDEKIADILNKMYNLSGKFGRRYNRNDAVYLFWEIIHDIFKDNLNFMKIFDFTKNIFYKKNLKERMHFGIWICLFIINYNNINWEYSFDKDNYRVFNIEDYIKNRNDIVINEEFVINDMHVSKKFNYKDFVDNGAFVDNEVLDDLINGVLYKNFYKEKGYEKSKLKIKGNKKECIIDDKLDFIDWKDFELIKIIDEGVCGSKLPVIWVSYKDNDYILKEFSKSMNYGRDYIFMDEIKKIFGLIDLDMKRIKSNKGLVRIDNKIKNYRNNSKIDNKNVVYCMMKYYKNIGDLGTNKKLLNNKEIRIESLKIRLFDGLFRSSDNILRNILVGENNELISIDEGDIFGKRKNIFNKKGDYNIKLMDKDELENVINEILYNINEHEIISLMIKYGFTEKVEEFKERFINYKNIVLNEIHNF